MRRAMGCKAGPLDAGLGMDIDGYIADTVFPPHFPWHFVPSWIDHVLLVNAIVPPRAARGPFRYLDLGCGPGFHLLAMAAGAPEAEFVGTDANPETTRRAGELARALGLDNVSFRTETFEQTAAAIRPEYDYASALGVLSWISAENRARVFQIIADALRPGGAAAIGYNSLPGRTGELLIQGMILDAVKRAPASQSASIAGTMDLIRDLATSGAQALQSDRIQAMLRSYEGQDPDFLPHEYLSEHWCPLASADMLRMAGRHGLEFVGALAEKEITKRFLLNKAQRGLIASMVDDVERERMVDLCLDQHFRRDLFVKAPRAGMAGADDRLAGFFVATCRPEDVVFERAMPAGVLRFDNPVARAILAALADGPRQLAEIAQPGTVADCLNTVDALIAAELIRPCDPPEACDVDGINTWILSEIAAGRATIRTLMTRHGAIKPPADVLEALAGGEQLSKEDAKRFGL
ncbi:MAG: class I SAM-dependent methyltransferase [Pseudomonadota bacterium]